MPVTRLSLNSTWISVHDTIFAGSPGLHAALCSALPVRIGPVSWKKLSWTSGGNAVVFVSGKISLNFLESAASRQYVPELVLGPQTSADHRSPSLANLLWTMSR